MTLGLSSDTLTQTGLLAYAAYANVPLLKADLETLLSPSSRQRLGACTQRPTQPTPTHTRRPGPSNSPPQTSKTHAGLDAFGPSQWEGLLELYVTTLGGAPFWTTLGMGGLNGGGDSITASPAPSPQPVLPPPPGLQGTAGGGLRRSASSTTSLCSIATASTLGSSPPAPGETAAGGGSGKGPAGPHRAQTPATVAGSSLDGGGSWSSVLDRSIRAFEKQRRKAQEQEARDAASAAAAIQRAMGACGVMVVPLPLPVSSSCIFSHHTAHKQPRRHRPQHAPGP